MRTRAEDALKVLLNKHFPDTTDEEKADILKEFRESIRF